jgi:undecaprenyl phosphate-alpha-L-ara4FN deformylase
VLVGLRIDVDTFKGTRDGVPRLIQTLADHGVKGSFFFSLGPDNMGRHLWRLLRLSFLKKMLRSKAASLYGWDIIFRGTLWPGPNMGEKLPHVMRDAQSAGHEIGLHAWDHHAWQARLDRMDAATIGLTIQKGYDALANIIGVPPVCSAVPSWKCNDTVLKKKAEWPFTYNSDCRGGSIFFPVVNGKVLSQPQIPCTLPTYDEVIGSNGITNNTYNGFILSLIRPDRLNVLTIHAEVEGMAMAFLFDRFLETASSRGISFMPLGGLLHGADRIETGGIIPGEIKGREGWVAVQQPLIK